MNNRSRKSQANKMNAQSTNRLNSKTRRIKENETKQEQTRGSRTQFLSLFYLWIFIQKGYQVVRHAPGLVSLSL